MKISAVMSAGITWSGIPSILTMTFLQSTMTVLIGKDDRYLETTEANGTVLSLQLQNQRS